MFVCVISLLFCASVSAIPNDRREVTYPSLETLRSGIKVVKFRAFGEDIELKLEPAGDVISDDFALVDNYGNSQKTDVKSLKNKLFKDSEKGAVLYINDDGILEINGIINSKLRIEPNESEDTVNEGIKAHLIIESSAEKKRFTDTVFRMNINEKFYESVRDFDESECVVIEYFCVADSTFSKLFNNDEKEIQTFVAGIFVKAQEMINTLKLNIKLVLIGLTVLKDDPPFIRESLIPGIDTIFNVGHIMQNISKKYCPEKANNFVVQADLIFLITRRAIGEPRPDGTVFDGIMGVANLGGTCNPCTKYGVIHAEKENMLSAANSLAHESAHLLGSPHDGEGADLSLDGSPTGIKCPGKEGYIMGNDYGENERKFSPCSKANIMYFLGKARSSCIVGAC
uniref:Metalloprotease n=1 Tax=Tityus melici TaxID=3026321 RepID=A0AA49K9S9_9SCOR|nr:putative metalloprotease [Tityus melici]